MTVTIVDNSDYDDDDDDDDGDNNKKHVGYEIHIRSIWRSVVNWL